MCNNLQVELYKHQDIFKIIANINSIFTFHHIYKTVKGVCVCVCVCVCVEREMDTGNKRLFITWVHSRTPLYGIPLGTNNFVPNSEVLPTQELPIYFW